MDNSYEFQTVMHMFEIGGSIGRYSGAIGIFNFSSDTDVVSILIQRIRNFPIKQITRFQCLSDKIEWDCGFKK